MDLTLSPSEQEFRDEVRAWLEQNHPGPEPESGLDEVIAFRREWQHKLHDAGWAGDLVAEGVRRPRRDADRAGDLRRRGGRAEAPSPANVLGWRWAGPVVMPTAPRSRRSASWSRS